MTVTHEEKNLPYVRECAEKCRTTMDDFNAVLLEAWKAGLEVFIEEDEHPPVIGTPTAPMRLKVKVTMEV